MTTAGFPIVTLDPFSHVFLDGLEDATTLYLIRHAQAQAGAVSPDPLDPPLTVIGRHQAERLAARLADEGFDALYSSPMLRALETAWPLAERTGLAIREDADLREVDFAPDPDDRDRLLRWREGFYETLEATRLGLPRHFRWDALPFTESSEAFRGRVLRSLDGIVRAHPGGRVAVVCHAGVINAYTAHVLGLTSDLFFLPWNTSITVVRTLGPQRVVHRLNDYEHLVRPQAPVARLT